MMSEPAKQYQILKDLFNKKNRRLALVKYQNQLGVLKKFKISNRKEFLSFNFEKNVLLNNTWSFVPAVIDHGEDYFIIEYKETKSNCPEDFQKYVSESFIEELVNKLLVINRSLPIKKAKQEKSLVLSVFKALYVLIPGGIGLSTALK